ncbi:MAG: hypothetical protein C0506_11025 [Anaerolinea sp.]|nr:hypothetical protein [Anaerolinea sp.]
MKVEEGTMSYMRYCSSCGVEVRCREDRQSIADSHSTRLRLSCPACGRVLTDIYDEQLEIKPVANARISRG